METEAELFSLFFLLFDTTQVEEDYCAVLVPSARAAETTPSGRQHWNFLCSTNRRKERCYRVCLENSEGCVSNSSRKRRRLHVSQDKQYREKKHRVEVSTVAESDIFQMEVWEVVKSCVLVQYSLSMSTPPPTPAHCLSQCIVERDGLNLAVYVTSTASSIDLLSPHSLTPSVTSPTPKQPRRHQ